MNAISKTLLITGLLVVLFASFFAFIGNPFKGIYGPDIPIMVMLSAWFLITLFFPLILSHFYRNGKGFLYGAVISIIINIIFYFVWTNGSEGFVFIINLFLGLISLIYLVIGFIAYKRVQSSVQK